MRIDAISDTTFAAEVLESDKPVLVDFTASWCPPCRAMNPILDEIAASRDDLRIVKLDVDDNQQTAAQYGVMSMPTFMRPSCPTKRFVRRAWPGKTAKT